MLRSPAPYPFAGSTALLGDTLVRIISVGRDGRRFVTGIGDRRLSRTVDLDDLSDAQTPDDPFAAWAAERIDRDGAGVSAVTDIYDDFARFAVLRGVDRQDLPGRVAFGTRLYRTEGLVSTVRRLPGRPFAERCVALTLKPLPSAS